MAARNREDKATDIPAWSWAVAAIGAVLVAGSTGFMLYKAFTGDFSPPRIAVEVASIIPDDSGYLVQIRVTNNGGIAAAAVVVEGVLKSAAGEETSTITLDYVPSGSHRHAGLFFSQDPRQLDLQLRAKGYVRP